MGTAASRRQRIAGLDEIRKREQCIGNHDLESTRIKGAVEPMMICVRLAAETVDPGCGIDECRLRRLKAADTLGPTSGGLGLVELLQSGEYATVNAPKAASRIK